MTDSDIVSTKLAAIQVATDLLDRKHCLSAEQWRLGFHTSDHIFVATPENLIEEADKIYKYLMRHP